MSDTERRNSSHGPDLKVMRDDLPTTALSGVIVAIVVLVLILCFCAWRVLEFVQQRELAKKQGIGPDKALVAQLKDDHAWLSNAGYNIASYDALFKALQQQKAALPAPTLDTLKRLAPRDRAEALQKLVDTTPAVRSLLMQSLRGRNAPYRRALNAMFVKQFVANPSSLAPIK